MKRPTYETPPEVLADGRKAYVYRNLLLMAANFNDELVDVHRANYVTAYQLSLDGNLPGTERAEHRKTAEREGFRLGARLTSLVGELHHRKNK